MWTTIYIPSVYSSRDSSIIYRHSKVFRLEITPSPPSSPSRIFPSRILSISQASHTSPPGALNRHNIPASHIPCTKDPKPRNTRSPPKNPRAKIISLEARDVEEHVQPIRTPPVTHGENVQCEQNPKMHISSLSHFHLFSFHPHPSPLPLFPPLSPFLVTSPLTTSTSPPPPQPTPPPPPSHSQRQPRP